MFMSVCVCLHCLGKRATSREPHPALPCFCVCVSVMRFNKRRHVLALSHCLRPAQNRIQGVWERQMGEEGCVGLRREEVRWKRIQKWPVPTSMVWTVFTSACVCYHKFHFLVIRSRDVWWKLLLGTSSLREEKKYSKCLRNESSCSVSLKKKNIYIYIYIAWG